TAHALELLDHRPACVILEADFEHRLAVHRAHRKIVDIALVFEDFGNRGLDLARGDRNRNFLRHLRIADARQHVGDRITHAHGFGFSCCLPARLDHTGNLAAHRDIAQLAAAQAEFTVHPARTTGQRATVAQTHRTRITWQLLQLEPRLVSIFWAHLLIV